MRSLLFCLVLSAAIQISSPVVSFGALVRGEVRDAFTGEPLAGAVVSGGGRVVETGSGGEFAIEVASGPVRVKTPGYRRSEVLPGDLPLQVRLEPFIPKALYLSHYGAGNGRLRNAALDLIERSELNAVVIDLKGDRGFISYRSAIPLAREIGAQKSVTLKELKAEVASLREQGIYTIGRIVVFKDTLLAEARPEWTVRDGAGEPWKDKEGLGWVDPHRREAWGYNLAIAVEAAGLGFDEVQFDYIRFPDTAGLTFSRENVEGERVAAIGGFLGEARKRLLPLGVFISADIFGYVCWNRNDTHIGQRLDALVPHVDYLAPMLYPSGFSHGVGIYRNPVANPYEIVYLSLEKARARTGISPVRFRPWLQAFRDYAFDRRPFGEQEVRAQIKASNVFGSNGWMLWNASNVYSLAGLETVDNKVAREQTPVAVEGVPSGT